MYEQALRKIRKPLKTDALQEESPRSKLVSTRIKQPEVSPQSDDPLALYREMAESIRLAGEVARGKSEALMEMASQPSRPKPVVEVKEEEPEIVDTETEEEDNSVKNKNKNLPDFSKIEKDDGRGYATGNVKDWLALMDEKEGGGNYSTLFGHSQKDKFSGVDVSKMTIGQLKEFSNPKGSYASFVKSKVGRVATPMGRYQFVGSTMSKVASEMGLSDDTVFDSKTQDAMFKFYLNKRISQGKTMDEKVSQVRNAWEGFKSVPSSQLAQLIRKTENANRT